MAGISKSQPLSPSVLDRLIRGEGGVQRGRGQLLRELKESLRRDLEDLLNTRRRPGAWPPHLDELEVSLVNYGIPDFTGANVGSTARQEEFRRMVERVVRTFEPRLTRVTVQVLKNQEPLDRTLRLRIQGLLQADPAPEPVVFDTALEPLTAALEVRRL